MRLEFRRKALEKLQSHAVFKSCVSLNKHSTIINASIIEVYKFIHARLKYKNNQAKIMQHTTAHSKKAHPTCVVHHKISKA